MNTNTLAADLLALVKEKGCVEVAWGIFLHTREDLLPLNKGFADAEDAEFWIASVCSNYMRPLRDGAKDSLLTEFIAAEGEEKIAKVIEAHRTDGIVLCEVDPDTMTFTVVEEAQPQPKKIEPTITCHHEPPWAIVKTQDIEILVETTQKLAFSVEIEAAIKCAKQDGATIADIENIVILIGACAEKTAMPTKLGGVERESAAKVAEDCKLHRAELLAQLRAIKTFADHIGLPSDKRYHIDALLSFNFERNEQSLSRMFDFASQQEKDEDKIFRIEEICKWFRLLKIGPAINVPKYDQTFVDAGRC